MTSIDTHYDIAIIGAGVAGLSAAYYLAPHANVVVLERESQPAYHSSGRSAAMYIEGYENPVVRDLTKAGTEFFFSPPTDFAENNLVGRCGGLTVAGPGQTNALQRYLDTWQPLCPELIAIDAENTKELVPILRQEWVSGATYDPSWHTIDVHELLSGYQRGLRSHGGAVVTGAELTKLQQQANGWHITAGKHNFQANIVVNAAGAWANQVAQIAGVGIAPLTPLRRSAAIVPAPEDSKDWPLVHTIGEDLYFKPESPGLMVCPQDETPSAPMDAFAQDLDIAIALDRFAQVANFPVNKVMHQWAGLRTFATDRKPVIGAAAGASNFFWLAGQGGYGVQTSPGLGQLTAEVLLNDATIPEQINVNRFGV